MSYAANFRVDIPVVVDLADQIRWLPGSDRFAPAEVRAARAVVSRVPLLVASGPLSSIVVVSGSDRRGRRGIWAQKKLEGARTLMPRVESALSRHPSLFFLLSRIGHLLIASFFFLSHSSFLPVRLLLPFFLPENQFEARCNARYIYIYIYTTTGHPEAERGCGQEARNFVKRVRGNNKTGAGTSCAHFHARKKTSPGGRKG